MILAPLIAISRLVAVAAETLNDTEAAVNLSAQQKSAATEPLVRAATECIVRAVVAHPRYGAGTGEALFMSPYLDVLPTAVVAAAKKSRH